MKIGLDIHGVITKCPTFFAELSKLFIEAGGEIHVITGSSLKLDTEYGKIALKEIEDSGVKYSHLFSIIDHHIDIGTKIVYTDSKNPWMDKTLWDKTKGEYCKAHRIDLMIDDSDAYGQYFTTPYAMIKIKSDTSK